MRLLPEGRRRGDIHFHFAKKMPYVFRMQVILALFFLGLFAQLLVNFWLGLILLGLGTLLSLVKGYSAVPEVVGKEEWGQVTPDEFKKVKDKQKQLQKWDIDCFDLTNPLGFCVFLLIGGGVFVLYIYLLGEGNISLGQLIIWDAAILLAPHWITGIRSYLKKHDLIIKIDILQEIIKFMSAPSDIQVLPMLSTTATKGGGSVPKDARLMIRYVNAPEYFLGMQVQISINNVQGNSYPYLYCVLIAKNDSTLFSGQIGLPPRGILYEKTDSSDVDVLVIRQKTTRTSGYYTNLSASKAVVQSSLDLMRNLLSRS